MSATRVMAQRFPRVVGSARRVRAGWRQVGDQGRFYGQTLGSVVDVVVHYRAEFLRQVAVMSLGTGALAIIGGTVAVVSFLNMSTGAIIAAQVYPQFSQVGVEALTGFGSAFLVTRLISLGTAVIAFAATLGAGATAQLGAMRINEEVDALEGMGVPSLPYLVTTRIVAGFVAVIPLYALGLISSYFGSRLVTVLFNGQSAGTYDHYFGLFLSPVDVLWSFLKVMLFSVVVILIHTYYGYRASGGPAGVGVAVGRAVRTAIVMINIIDFFMSLAIWGATTTVRVAG
jgi:phospholipid/cholesterol/gamma-HCH transport system permease protein